MLAFLLLQNALGPVISNANGRARLPDQLDGFPAGDPHSHPYLKITSALALRFRATQPPNLSHTSPPAGASPQPGTVAAEPMQAPPAPPPAKEMKPVAREPASLPPPKSAEPNYPPSILPDDTHAPTRPEDILPYFLIPGSNSDVTIMAPSILNRLPTPSQLPASSATYQQK
ncbi:MAG: hypothetical protein WCR49_04740 [Opitutae bacterium]